MCPLGLPAYTILSHLILSLPSFSRSNLIAVPNPDLPFVQFVGDISGDEPGTVSEFYLLGSGNEKGLYLNALFIKNANC